MRVRFLLLPGITWELCDGGGQMLTGSMNCIAGKLRRLTSFPMFDGRTDRELLEAYVRDGVEEAFSAVVRRHAALVLGVSVRVLRNEADAHDVFQAVFLVLARKAAVVRWRPSIAGWLSSAAYRLALKARAQRAQRRRKELAACPRRNDVADRAEQRDLIDALVKEVQRLPERYLDPIVLCYWQQLSQDEAAKRLRISVGAFRGRLHRARALLLERCRRRGLGSALAVSAGGFVPTVAMAAAPEPLLRHTIGHAIHVGACGTFPASLSPAVAQLTQGALQTMLMTKMTSLIAVAVSLTVLAGVVLAVGGDAAPPAPAVPPNDVPALLALAKHDDDGDGERHSEAAALSRRTLVGKLVSVGAQEVLIEIETEQELHVAFAIAPGARIVVARSPATLGQLAAGQHVAARLGPDNKSITHLRVMGPRSEGVLVGIDHKAGVATVLDDDDDEKNTPIALPLAKNCRAMLNSDVVALEDLEKGFAVQLEYSADRKTVVEIQAELPRENDVLRSRLVRLDADKGTIAIEDPEDDDKELLLDLASKDVKVRLDGKAAQLTELPRECTVVLRQNPAADVIAIWAQSRQLRHVPLVD